MKHIVDNNEGDGPVWNDVEIWHAVFDLVAQTNELLARTKNSPASGRLDKVVLNTPFRCSLAALSGTEQIHAEVDQQICEDLIGRVFVDVGSFFE